MSYSMRSFFFATFLGSLLFCVTPCNGGGEDTKATPKNSVGDNSVATWTITPHLALQNQYTSHPVSCWGVESGAWTIQGYALKASKNMTVQEFVDTTEEQIQSQLLAYISSTNGLHGLTTDILVLDIEHPVHPKDWGKYYEKPFDSNVSFEELIDAFELRIDVARNLFPNAKIALYGVVVPHPKGVYSPMWSTRWEGYLEAGTEGVYDDLDYLVPVVYSRFSYEQPENNEEITQHQIEKMVIQAIDEADKLKTSNNDSIPLFPLTSFYIFNGMSSYHNFKAEPSALAIIINKVEERLAAADPNTDNAYGFWNGVQGGNSDILEPVHNTDPYRDWTIPCYLYNLYGNVSGAPGCNAICLTY